MHAQPVCRISHLLPIFLDLIFVTILSVQLELPSQILFLFPFFHNENYQVVCLLEQLYLVYDKKFSQISPSVCLLVAISVSASFEKIS